MTKPISLDMVLVTKDNMGPCVLLCLGIVLAAQFSSPLCWNCNDKMSD